MSETYLEKTILLICRIGLCFIFLVGVLILGIGLEKVGIVLPQFFYYIYVFVGGLLTLISGISILIYITFATIKMAMGASENAERDRDKNKF